MRIAVLCSPFSWYFRDLQRAAASEHELLALPFSRIHASLGGESSGRCHSSDSSLDDSDAVLVRTMPPGSLEQVIFRMNVLGQLAERGTVVLNPPRAIEIAVDKYLALARLQQAGLRVPETRVSQTAEEAMAAYDDLDGDAVVKPIFGGEGRGMMRVEDVDLAYRTFTTLERLGAVIYQQRFIQHSGFDIRLLCIGERCWAMKRRNNTDWRTNISRGGVAESVSVEADMREIAFQAANVVGAPIAGVDLLPDGCGGYYVLEVNAVPGWQALSRVCEVDIAAEVLRFVHEPAGLEH